MARRPVTLELVLEAATAELDERGADGLTLAAVAHRLGMKTPSLYNHVEGLGGLRRELRLRGIERLEAELARATMGRARGEALRALASAYRRFARAHPGLYAVTQVADGDDRIAEAGARVVAVVVATLEGFALAGERAVHATRVLRSALHGFVSLEANGGFGLELDLDETFALMVDGLEAALERLAAPRKVGAAA